MPKNECLDLDTVINIDDAHFYLEEFQKLGIINIKNLKKLSKRQVTLVLMSAAAGVFSLIAYKNVIDNATKDQPLWKEIAYTYSGYETNFFMTAYFVYYVLKKTTDPFCASEPLKMLTKKIESFKRQMADLLVMLLPAFLSAIPYGAISPLLVIVPIIIFFTILHMAAFLDLKDMLPSIAAAGETKELQAILPISNNLIVNYRKRLYNAKRNIFQTVSEKKRSKELKDIYQLLNSKDHSKENTIPLLNEILEYGDEYKTPDSLLINVPKYFMQGPVVTGMSISGLLGYVIETSELMKSWLNIPEKMKILIYSLGSAVSFPFVLLVDLIGINFVGNLFDYFTTVFKAKRFDRPLSFQNYNFGFGLLSLLTVLPAVFSWIVSVELNKEECTKECAQLAQWPTVVGSPIVNAAAILPVILKAAQLFARFIGSSEKSSAALLEAFIEEQISNTWRDWPEFISVLSVFSDDEINNFIGREHSSGLLAQLQDNFFKKGLVKSKNDTFTELNNYLHTKGYVGDNENVKDFTPKDILCLMRKVRNINQDKVAEEKKAKEKARANRSGFFSSKRERQPLLPINTDEGKRNKHWFSRCAII